jgi:uncharacterized protein (DUF169 family)
MKSAIAESLKCRYSPVAVILTNEKPADATQFKEGRWGCVAAMLVTASRGRSGIFSRSTFGCVGGGVGLGFGNQYEEQNFPIEHLLSNGNNEEMNDRGHRIATVQGEKYFESAELAGRFVSGLPMTDVPTEYVLFKPMADIDAAERPELVIFMVNPDQLSALVVLANYDRAEMNTVISPFGAGCQSILFGYAEAKKNKPRAIIGFFDITSRKLVDPDILSFTVPYAMYRGMEANVEKSFLKTEQWTRIAERI